MIFAVFVKIILFYNLEYAIAIEQGINENSRLVLNKCALNAKQRERVKKGESIEQVIQHEDPVETTASEAEPK